MNVKWSTLICFLTLASTVFGQNLESDRQALVALYNATDGNNWIHKDNWLVQDSSPCDWYGITCDVARSRVIGIDLHNNALTGELPAELGQLTALEVIDMERYMDFFVGPRYNDAYESHLWGAIPVEIGNLRSLKSLELGGNYFTGSIPSTIGNLTQLEYLSLYFGEVEVGFGSHGTLNGIIPSEIGNLIKLKTFFLNNQNASGAIPSSLANLKELKHLSLSGNNFTGQIPSGLGQLTKLEVLNLSYNGYRTDEQQKGKHFGNLTGPIPDFSALPTNAAIDLEYQSFTFDGMADNMSRLVGYSPQNRIPLQYMEAFPLPYIIEADAGAKSQPYPIFYDNNFVYHLYENDILLKTQEGDGKFFVGMNKKYRIEVTHKLVPGLTIISDEVLLPKRSMPVTLLSFDGKSGVDGNVLRWKTVSETSNAGFEIERGVDGKVFEKIGFVDGGGNSQNMKEYTFTDKQPYAQSYYRLKQIDFDGKSELSNIISVKRAQESISVYPNPATGSLSFKNLGEEATVIVRNSTGMIVLRQVVSPVTPLNTVKLPNGSYTITVGAESKKIVIQK